MARPITLLLMACLLLQACGFRDSGLNPVNWFGRRGAAEVEPQNANTNPLIPQTGGGLFSRRRAEVAAIDLTTPIASVTGLRLEPIPGGIILRAEGVDTAQGAFNVELVPENPRGTPVNGVLSYTLERQRPTAAQPPGPERARTVVVAIRLTDQQLRGVRVIRVSAAQNSRELRR